MILQQQSQWCIHVCRRNIFKGFNLYQPVHKQSCFTKIKKIKEQKKHGFTKKRIILILQAKVIFHNFKA